MKIGVLVKTVKFVYAQTGTDVRSSNVGPDDVVRMVNPQDEMALEYALEIKERSPGAKVVAIALGDRFAEEGLRRALAMGADHAVHVHYDDSERLDPVAVSALLARVCRRENFDLVLCGQTAIDDNEGLDGPYLAERLGLPHVSRVARIAFGSQSGRLAVERLLERSDRQVLDCPIPVVLMVQRGETVPRYPTLAGFLRAESAAIEALKPEALGFSGAAVLQSMTRTEVTGYCNPKPKIKAASGEGMPSAAERIRAMVTRDASKEKAGGKVVAGNSAEMFAGLDMIFQETGILKD